MAATENNGKGPITGIIAGLAGAVGIFACMAVITSLSSAASVTELLQGFLVATGNVGEYETMVDFYTHIKGVEYLMAGAFFVAFPVFFKYISKDKTAVKV